jgi:hypothetical protein
MSPIDNPSFPVGHQHRERSRRWDYHRSQGRYFSYRRAGCGGGGTCTYRAGSLLLRKLHCLELSSQSRGSIKR